MTTDMSDEEKRPYFLWDEDTSIGELRAALTSGPADERDRLLAKLLREANDVDVWAFVRPEEVAAALPRLERFLGRRRDFWRFLINGWRQDGLLR